MPITRGEFKRLARTRLRDAEVLLNNRRFDAAYYLCGYVIECALKACFLKNVRRYEIPDRQVVLDFYTHDLRRLIKVTGLESELENEIQRDPEFEPNWRSALEWSEQSRYARAEERQVLSLYHAVSDADHGVLQWLERYW